MPMCHAELHQDLRAGVRDLCKAFPDAYWRELDAARAYPDAFVDGADARPATSPR